MSEDRRQNPRVPLNLLIQFRFDTLEDFLCEYAENISEGGIYIHTDEVRAPGAMVYIQFVLKDGTKLIEGLGQVVHVAQDGGLGVEFVSVDEESKAMIKGIVDRRAQG